LGGGDDDETEELIFAGGGLTPLNVLSATVNTSR
jgi:hypothetical protein